VTGKAARIKAAKKASAAAQKAAAPGKSKPSDQGQTAAGGQARNTELLSRIYQLRDRALNAQLRGDFGEASSQLREAVRLSGEYQGERSPTETLLYLDLAGAAEAAGQVLLAGEAYRQCLERNPRSAQIRLKFASLLARTGELAEAEIQARQALVADPRDPSAHLLLALVLERQGKREEAELEKARSRELLTTSGSEKTHPTTAPPQAPSQAPPASEPESKLQPGKQAPDLDPSIGLP